MTNRTLPQLAVDFNPAKARYPLWGFAKIDGVRGVHVEGGLTGRSMDPFKNSAVVAKFSDPVYAGFDGELTIDGRLTGSDLCSLTTGLMNRAKIKKGETALPDNACWNLFDYLDDLVIDLMYCERYTALADHINKCQPPHVHLLPYTVIENEEQALAFIETCLDGTAPGLNGEPCEGAIFRDPAAQHKSGRATEKLNDYWRFKPVSDKDALVLEVYEADENLNEAKKNSLGRTERSSHQENKVGKGVAGGFICRDIETGDTIRVPAGCMKHDERKAVFENPALIVGQHIKYRSLDTGLKDAPRQARYICRRAAEDMS